MAAMLAEVQQLGAQAAKLAATPLWPLPDDGLTPLLQAAHRLEQAVAVLRARIVHQATTGRGLPTRHGYRSTSTWLRQTLLLDPHPARELAVHATVIGQSPTLEQALLDGHLTLHQATVIADTIKAIPTALADAEADADADAEPGVEADADADAVAGEVSLADIKVQAEHVMIGMCDRLPAYQLRRVGERILTHVAPEIADRVDEAVLARQEARARLRRGVTLSLPVDGMVRLTGMLDAEDAATVQAALHPLCTPIPGDERTAPQRRADALIDICRLALRTGELPDDGGEPPQLAVTIAYHPLIRTLTSAVTDIGQRLSATTARRIACDARVLPIMLGGDSQILDAGRTRRLATGPLRRALTVRDRGCAFPDCDRPARWTDAHHITSWLAGGPTSLHNLVLLCRHHHRLIHDPDSGWHIQLGADHHPDFIPPPRIDRQQRPRRNLYHHRQ